MDPNAFTRAEIIIVSDVHIRNNADREFNLLINQMAKLTSHVKYFIFLGDVFDFCFGSSQFHRDQYQALHQEIKRLHTLGCQVIFLEGNHEFNLEALNWPEMRIVPGVSFQLRLTETIEIAFSHGDLFNAPWHYHLFRKIIKSKLAFSLASLIPDLWFDRFALRLAAGSRSLDRYRFLNHQRILKDATKWLEGCGSDFGIFGHFHVPYAEDVSFTVKDGSKLKNATLICSHSWQKPNFLCYLDGKFLRYFFEQDGSSKVEELKSFFN